MKTISQSIFIFFIGILFFKCSNSTETEPTSLDEVLLGIYRSVGANYQPDSTNNQILDASATDSVYLIINSNKKYSMRLELYVETLDTVISLIQEGSYVLSNTRYSEVNGVNPAHWDGRIEFIPLDSSLWGGNFRINIIYPYLHFTEFVFISIPNSKGRFLVFNWIKWI